MYESHQIIIVTKLIIIGDLKVVQKVIECMLDLQCTLGSHYYMGVNCHNKQAYYNSE